MTLEVLKGCITGKGSLYLPQQFSRVFFSLQTDLYGLLYGVYLL